MKRLKLLISIIIFIISVLLVIAFGCLNSSGRSVKNESSSSVITSEGSVNFNRDIYEGKGAVVRITLADSDLTKDQIDVDVTSDSDLSGITVTLTKSGSIYTGVLELTTDSSDTTNDILDVSGGETLILIYNDDNPIGIRTDTAIWYDKEIFRIYTESYTTGGYNGTEFCVTPGVDTSMDYYVGGGGSATASVTEDTTIAYEGAKSFKVMLNSPSLSEYAIAWFGVPDSDPTIDLSAFIGGYIKFALYKESGGNITNGQIGMKSDPPGGGDNSLILYDPVLVPQGEWKDYSILISDLFPTLNLDAVRTFFCIDTINDSVVWYIDDIRLVGP